MPPLSWDNFTNVATSSQTQYCTLKSICILNSDLEYLKTVDTRRVIGTLSLVCHESIVFGNMAMDICVLKTTLFLRRILFNGEISLRALNLSETIPQTATRVRLDVMCTSTW